MNSEKIRSALFVPGSRPERYIKAMNSNADRVIIDFEDSVEEPLKRQARDNLAAFFKEYPDARVLVRINSPEHAEHIADIAFCQAHSSVTGVLLPKTESAMQVNLVADTGKPVWPIIESARGLLALLEISRAKGVERLSFGSLDLGLDLNLTNGAAANLIFDQARFLILLHSRAANLAPPLDGVHPVIHDTKGLRVATRRAYEMGFSGALCIHPQQIPVIHAALMPSDEELAWAKKVVEADNKNTNGAYKVDGQMVDAPVLMRALRVLASSNNN